MTTWGREVLPYGVFSVGGGPRKVGVAVDDGVLDLSDLDPTGSLDAHLAAGPAAWAERRERVQVLVMGDPELVPLTDVQLHLPWTVGDYVDFYASEQHATNLGRMFRPDSEPLLPHWRQLPVGYHGRAGTVVVSGTDVVRPRGLRLPGPELGPTAKLDVEVELGFVVGVGSALGTSVPTTAFADHVFGVVVVNDWSARDVQAYEYVPLGPFLGKSFATSVSPWVVPLAALPRVAPPVQDPAPAPYLRVAEDWGLDVELELSVNGTVLSRPPFAGMYWTAPQMLAHLTVNGASLRTGDLFASGTVSGDDVDQRGSLIELTWNGQAPVLLDDGTSRAFLEDGDEAVVSATAGGRPLGEVRGRVVRGR